MKKALFLTLASVAFAVGFTCCSGGSDNVEISPAAKFVKGKTLSIISGAAARIEFDDEMWGGSSHTLPCHMSVGSHRSACSATILAYTFVEGADPNDKEPQFATMQIRFQYDTGTVNAGHYTFWGFPKDCIWAMLGSNGAVIDMTFNGANKETGVCSLAVKKGAKFEVHNSSEQDEFIVTDDNIYEPVDGDAIEKTLGSDGTTADFTFYTE